MKNKTLILILFGVMAAAQLAVPLFMMNSNEQVITDGNEYWFRTAPVDPYDPLRGKYISLNFGDVSWTDSLDTSWTYADEGTDVYVELTRDSAGFAIPLYVTRERPVYTNEFIVAKLDYITQDSLPRLHLTYPFNRMYMDEDKSMNAEQLYVESNRRDTTSLTYAVVMVKAGESVLTDVRIDGVSIRELAGAMEQEE